MRFFLFVMWLLLLLGWSDDPGEWTLGVAGNEDRLLGFIILFGLAPACCLPELLLPWEMLRMLFCCLLLEEEEEDEEDDEEDEDMIGEAGAGLFNRYSTINCWITSWCAC